MRKNASGTWEAIGGTVGEDGKPDGKLVVSGGTLTLPDLPGGDYKLKETKAPTGYIIKNAEITFTVTIDDRRVYISNVNPEDAAKVTGTNKDILWVVNTPGQTLPSTGGTGTMKYTVAGAILILTALCFGCALRRRERRFFE